MRLIYSLLVLVLSWIPWLGIAQTVDFAPHYSFRTSLGREVQFRDWSVPIKITDLNETILKYEEFLREETKLHRQYTQEYYNILLKLFAGIGIVVGAVLTWLNWKSKEDIKKQVNKQFEETIQGLLDEKLKQIDNSIKEGKEKSDEKLKQIDNLIKEGKEKSEKQFQDIGRIFLELSAMRVEIDDSAQREIVIDEQLDVEKLKGKSILWVDDFPANNEFPTEMLRQAGVIITPALNTESAVKKLEEGIKFNLIISDMGRGNNHSAGLDLLKELQRLNNNTPTIIFSSQRAIDKFGKDALNLGAIAVTNGMIKLLNHVQTILKN